MMRFGVGMCVWCLAACVQWQSVAPPPTPTSATSREPRLPRWVRVTTRDSVHYQLEDAWFRGDTLIGRGSDDESAPLVLLPATDIAHLEARVPSLGRSAGMAALLLSGLFALAVASFLPTT